MLFMAESVIFPIMVTGIPHTARAPLLFRSVKVLDFSLAPATCALPTIEVGDFDARFGNSFPKMMYGTVSDISVKLSIFTVFNMFRVDSLLIIFSTDRKSVV